MIYLNLFLLTIIIVNIVDISGIVDNIKRMIWKWLKPDKQYIDFNLKPFDCSYCMTFWTGLIYIICINAFSILNIMVILLFAFITPYIRDFQQFLGDMINKLIDKLYKLL